MSKKIILGISSFGHDAACALVCQETGETLYAIAEERLNNLKHAWQLPYGSLLESKKIAAKNGWQIVEAAINFRHEEFTTGTLIPQLKHLLSVEQQVSLSDLLNQLVAYGDHFQPGSFSDEMLTDWLSDKELKKDVEKEIRIRVGWYFNWSIKYRHIAKMIEDLLGGIPMRQINHHLCHAASTFYPSGFRDSCVITWDGQGESQTTCVYKADSKGIHLVAETAWPFSLGMLYFGVTNYLGFKLGDEFKVMGMAAYGEPRFAGVLAEILEIKDGPCVSFKASDYYARQEFVTGHFWYYFTSRMESLVPKRRKHGEILQAHFDFAASMQKVFEDFGVQFAKRALEVTGMQNLCLAGGVALNGLMNEAIRLKSGCKNLYVFPAAGDDGTAPGAALICAHENAKMAPQKMSMPFLGGDFSDADIIATLKKLGVVYEKPVSIQKQIAEAIARQEIVARFYGRSEFGPRALGHRSILASPAKAEMKDVINERIKHREMFRPFAPACLEEHAARYFEIDVEAPYMLLIAPATKKARLEIPAAVHADGTSRLQTISKDENGDFYQIIAEVEKITGTPVVINTSFNINGEAIVETPQDAVESFAQMDIDHLAIGDYWISKSNNKFPSMSDTNFLELRKQRFTAAHQHILVKYNILRDYFARPDQKKGQGKSFLSGLFQSLSARIR